MPPIEKLEHLVAILASVISMLAMLGVFAYVRKIARVLNVVRDYPPHKHVGAFIQYPPDFAPGKVEAQSR